MKKDFSSQVRYELSNAGAVFQNQFVLRNARKAKGEADADVRFSNEVLRLRVRLRNVGILDQIIDEFFGALEAETMTSIDLQKFLKDRGVPRSASAILANKVRDDPPHSVPTANEVASSLNEQGISVAPGEIEPLLRSFAEKAYVCLVIKNKAFKTATNFTQN